MRIPKNFTVNNSNPLKKFTQKPINLDDKIKETLKTLLKRTENEVPPYGRLFGRIEEEFQNPDLLTSANKIKFLIKPSTDTTNQTDRILEMKIFAKNGNNTSPFFKVGTKEKLLEILKDEELPKIIKNHISIANLQRYI